MTYLSPGTISYKTLLSMDESDQGVCGVFELNRVFEGCLAEQGV